MINGLSFALATTRPTFKHKIMLDSGMFHEHQSSAFSGKTTTESKSTLWRFEIKLTSDSASGDPDLLERNDLLVVRVAGGISSY